MLILENAHPREIVRGLMRGNRAEFKLGYDARSAVLAVQSLQDLSDEEVAELQQYAEGFAHGLVEDNTRTNPAEKELT